MTFLAGDIVSRRKGLVMHHGIVLEDGRVLHNTPLQGEHVSSFGEFSRGNRVHGRNLSLEQRRSILSKVDSKEENGHQRYNLFTNNCEHLVTGATSHKPRSPQLGGWLVGAGVAAAVLALTRHPGWAITSFYTGKAIYKRVAKAIDE